MTRPRCVPAVLALPLLLAATACAGGSAPDAAPAPPTSTGPIGAANVPLVTTIDVPGSRAALEAGQAGIAQVLTTELGGDRWRQARAAQEVACPSRVDSTGSLDDGIGKFYAREMRHPVSLVSEDWDRVVGEVARAVEPHGFRPRPAGDGPVPPGTRYVYLVNDHLDELTLSTHPENGTGHGGFGVCHPWGD